jgi:hypothetical protein
MVVCLEERDKREAYVAQDAWSARVYAPVGRSLARSLTRLGMTNQASPSAASSTTRPWIQRQSAYARTRGVASNSSRCRCLHLVERDRRKTRWIAEARRGALAVGLRASRWPRRRNLAQSRQTIANHDRSTRQTCALAPRCDASRLRFTSLNDRFPQQPLKSDSSSR